jgi:hypothetical protein
VKKTVGDNCITKGCGEGKSCEVAVQAAIVVFQCKEKCDPLAPKCPAGSTCGASHNGPGTSVCYKSCESPRDCPDGEVCTSAISENRKRWGCIPNPGPGPKADAVTYDPEGGEEPFRPDDD